MELYVRCRVEYTEEDPKPQVIAFSLFRSHLQASNLDLSPLLCAA
jgi:hypothetical protein